MNERIEKMIEQATKREYYVGICGYESLEFDKEKFAELLITECAIIANRAENNDAELRCMYSVIMEHFGVK